MNRAQKLSVGGILLIALIALGAYLALHLQPYQDSIDHGPSPEARSNNYLAAELFLRQRKLSVSRASSLEALQQLPSAGQTLLLLASRHNMTPRQVRQVLDWTAAGGHLVFVAEALWDDAKGHSDDLLLDSLDIRQLSPPEQEESDEASEPDPHPELTKIWLENEEAPAYADFATEFHLEDHGNRAYAWANSAAATHMLQLEHGQGLVTVLTDAWIWENARINQYDHAWLLWYLAQDSEVTLIHDSEYAGLFSQLLKHFPAALAALALLLAMWLWRAGQRHGPLLPPVSSARRQLEEHLRASADFLLRRVGQQHLLQSLQRDIQRRARQRHPGFERLAVADQWQVLGRLSRQPSSAISTAMRPVSSQRLSAADFTRQVTHLQTLRNAI